MTSNIPTTSDSPVQLAKAPVDLVKFVQSHLVRLGYLHGAKEVDGIAGPKTLAAYRQFKQDNYLAEPELIGQTTMQKLMVAKSAPSKKLQETDYQKAAQLLGVNVAAIKAVVLVETSGSGFFSDGRPKILFEAHWFSKFTNGKYDRSHPQISSRRWNRSLYYGGVREYIRLQQAQQLSPTAALMSASWGLGQIMGFNFRACGYSDVAEFVEDAHISEGKQLEQMCKFIQSQKLAGYLRERNWAGFAYRYNGEGYQKNRYDVHLAAAYQRFA